MNKGIFRNELELSAKVGLIPTLPTSILPIPKLNSARFEQKSSRSNSYKVKLHVMSWGRVFLEA